MTKLLFLALILSNIFMYSCGFLESGTEATGCETVNCNNHGVCAVPNSKKAMCFCDDGYYADGLTCIEIGLDEKSCDTTKLVCGSNSTCNDESGRAECFCDIGYLSKNNLCAEPYYTHGVDYSTAMNNYGGFYNTPNYPNNFAFAALKNDGSIKVWGDTHYAGDINPLGNDFIDIASTYRTFAALKSDGSIIAWGDGYTKIYSTSAAFTAVRVDGSLVSWGNPLAGGENSPVNRGYHIPYGEK